MNPKSQSVSLYIASIPDNEVFSFQYGTIAVTFEISVTNTKSRGTWGLDPLLDHLPDTY